MQGKACPARISWAWMLCKKLYIVPIPGTRKPERMRENAGTVEIVLMASEVSTLDKMLDTMEVSAVSGGTKTTGKQEEPQ